MAKTFDNIDFNSYNETLDTDNWIIIFNILYPIINNAYDNKPIIIETIENSSLFIKANSYINNPVKTVTLCITFIFLLTLK